MGVSPILLIGYFMLHNSRAKYWQKNHLVPSITERIDLWEFIIGRDEYLPIISQCITLIDGYSTNIIMVTFASILYIQHSTWSYILIWYARKNLE